MRHVTRTALPDDTFHSFFPLKQIPLCIYDRYDIAPQYARNIRLLHAKVIHCLTLLLYIASQASTDINDIIFLSNLHISSFVSYRYRLRITIFDKVAKARLEARNIISVMHYRIANMYYMYVYCIVTR